MILNLILIVLIVSGVGYFINRQLNSSKIKRNIDDFIEEDKHEIDYIVSFVTEEIDSIVRNNLHQYNLTRDEYEKRVKNRVEMKKALKECAYGDINAKNYVKALIKDILLKEYKITEENIDMVINFTNIRELHIQDKFEIILYKYKTKYGKGGLENLIKEFQLDDGILNDEGVIYEITKENIETLYKSIKPRLRFEEKLDVITQRIYQIYKGFGVIDEIRDMKIDGVSGGVSGLPANTLRKISEQDSKPLVYENVWIFFKGKQIRLAFLSFGNEKELMRVCKNIYRYNNPGQLSESNGYKVNEMYDGSRVVVARPPFAESWSFFVRKLDAGSLMKIEELVVDENKELPIETIKWLIKGNRTFALTGSQGTGKTTMLMAIIKYINPSFTLRIQEMAFELNLRNIYPKRNILSFRETSEISGQEGLNLQKKTDGTVNILGEVADEKVASWMVQMAQVASLFTIFTHHAKTSYNLITSIRNNLLQTGVFSNETIAEKQVAETITFDIHLTKNVDGHRYIDRITEIVPLTEYKKYSSTYKEEKELNNKLSSFFDTTTDYYGRVTDRKVFETKDIIRWVGYTEKELKEIKEKDPTSNVKGKYVVVNKISEKMKEEILMNLDVENKDKFLKLNVV